MLSNLFTHPLPQSFDRVQVRAVARKRDHDEAQIGGSALNLFAAVPGSAIPNDDGRQVRRAKPACQMGQELNRVLRVARSFVPDEDLTGAEVVGAVSLPDTFLAEQQITRETDVNVDR